MNKSNETALRSAALLIVVASMTCVAFAQEQAPPQDSPAASIGRSQAPPPSEPDGLTDVPQAPSADTAAAAQTAAPSAPDASDMREPDGVLPTVTVIQKVRPKPASLPTRMDRTTGGEPSTTESAGSAPAQQALSQGAPAASAAAARQTPETPMSLPLNGTSIRGGALAQSRPATSDTASLLKDVPGVSLATGGGVSGLPAIDGLADDRVRIIINGRETTSACANHMNPPLSYADPAQVKSITVSPGVTPVSQGGDSLGGTISVDTGSAAFADSDEGVVTHGSLSAAYRSNGRGVSTGASASAASQHVSVSYSGAWTRADNYKDGSGDLVGSTLYEAQNHTGAVSIRDGGDLYTIEGGYQYIPYQGFVNQPMDMVLNEGWNIGGRYETASDWGKLALNAYYHSVRHAMNFLDDKQRSFAAQGWGDDWTMPMNTEGQDAGYAARVEIPAAAGAIIRAGNELHYQTLEDWWPAVCATPFCGMGPQEYRNIHDGERLRVGTYLEWEQDWGQGFSTLVGARNDTVVMSTGDAQAYERIDGDPDSDAADAFNAEDRNRTDVNFDLSALVRYEPRDGIAGVEAGYARKTRSPNLYERYAWGVSPMVSQMVTWFGDSNGYVGNLDLEPEVAHRLSLTLGLHDAERRIGEVKVTPYMTFVDDYINAELSNEPGWVNGFNQLRFVNHDARLYGVDIAARVRLADSDTLGQLTLAGSGGYVHGEDRVTGNPLYHMMPWNGRLGLEHKRGGWTSVAEVQMVDGKTRVDDLRLEPVTAGYTLVNLRTSYELENVRLDLGVENVFDRLYYSPLGGTNYTDYLFPGHAVAGAGRSFYSGLTLKF